MNAPDAERFDRIRRKIQYGATIKDLFWLVRLVEKLEKQVARPREEPKAVTVKPKKTVVNFFFVEVADPSAHHGKKWGVECDVCGDQFFDKISRGKNPRMLASGIPIAIDHAKKAHGSTGGVVGHQKAAAALAKSQELTAKSAFAN